MWSAKVLELKWIMGPNNTINLRVGNCKVILFIKVEEIKHKWWRKGWGKERKWGKGRKLWRSWSIRILETIWGWVFFSFLITESAICATRIPRERQREAAQHNNVCNVCLAAMPYKQRMSHFSLPLFQYWAKVINFN